MDVTISTKGLRKEFGDVSALDGATMSVPRGSVYGLVGPNGAGKSTLMSILAGVVRPTGGEALVLGGPVSAASKGRTTWIPSEPSFLSSEGVDGMARFLARVRPGFDPARFEELGQTFGLDRRKPLRRMSRGMRKQAAFWLALSLVPDVLLLDEPMDGLDPLARRAVWGLVLSEVASRQLTVLVSSHNLRELEGICDHLGILSRGRILHESSLVDAESELSKVQVVLPEGAVMPKDLAVESSHADGRMLTLVIRGDAEEVRRVLTGLEPQYLQARPLSLEELYLFEMGGKKDDLADSIL